jgi:hypothetical protein
MGELVPMLYSTEGVTVVLNNFLHISKELEENLKVPSKYK